MAWSQQCSSGGDGSQLPVRTSDVDSGCYLCSSAAEMDAIDAFTPQAPLLHEVFVI